jgi:hypothetical protein
MAGAMSMTFRPPKDTKEKMQEPAGCAARAKLQERLYAAIESATSRRKAAPTAWKYSPVSGP